jgi:hypothetical protein
MSENERDIRTDDDVVGHSVKKPVAATEPDDVAGHVRTSATEDDDVAGHVRTSATEDDDVEGHVRTS